MPRRDFLLHPTAQRCRFSGGAVPAKSLLPAVDSEPRDWSDAGRRVLAEAQRRATDELIRRGAVPASVVPEFPHIRSLQPNLPPLAPEAAS
jgi:hypothetical protein